MSEEMTPVLVDGFDEVYLDALVRLLAGPKGILVFEEGSTIDKKLEVTTAPAELPTKDPFSLDYDVVSHVIGMKDGFVIVPKGFDSSYPLPYPLPKDEADGSVKEEIVAHGVSGKQWSNISHVVASGGGLTVVPSSESDIELENFIEPFFDEPILLDWNNIHSVLITEDGISIIPENGQDRPEASSKYPYPYPEPTDKAPYPFPGTNKDGTYDDGYPYPTITDVDEEESEDIDEDLNEIEETPEDNVDSGSTERYNPDENSILISSHGLAILDKGSDIRPGKSTAYNFEDSVPIKFSTENLGYVFVDGKGVTISLKKSESQDDGTVNDYNEWTELPHTVEITKKVELPPIEPALKTTKPKSLDVPTNANIFIPWTDLMGVMASARTSEIVLLPIDFEIGQNEQKQQSSESDIENDSQDIIVDDDAESENAVFVDHVKIKVSKVVDEEGQESLRAICMKAIVLPYIDNDGNKIMILKCPDAVEDSVELWRHRFLTDNHPESRVVTDVDEVKGFVDDPVWDEEEQGVNVRLNPMNGLEFNENSHISPGFRARVVFQEGEFNGKRYDAVQTHILPDHLAKVDQGRCKPEDGCRVFLATDEADIEAQIKDFQDQTVRLQTEIDELREEAKKPYIRRIMTATNDFAMEELMDKSRSELEKMAGLCDHKGGLKLQSNGSGSVIDDAYAEVRNRKLGDKR